MINSKLYVVNSLNLISSIQRMPESLAFPPLEAKFATIVCSSSKESNDIIANNLNGEDEDWGYSHDLHTSVHLALAPGPGLDAMNRVMIHNITRSLNLLKPHKCRLMEVNLGEWSRHEITMATTNSVYGKFNPFKDPEVEKAFW